MNKCGRCGKETDYKSSLFDFVIVNDTETHKPIKCFCKECEKIVLEEMKKY